MEIISITHPHEFHPNEEVDKVMALGFFDGVHLGHQKVIETAIQIAREKGYKTAVMTFHPHPTSVLRNQTDIEYITPLAAKEKWIEKLGVDFLYIIEFTRLFAELTPQAFVDQYIIALSVKHVVAGFDYTYGKLGRGTMETLPFHSRGKFQQTTVEKLTSGDVKVSSTEIRHCIEHGQVDMIPLFLGRPYEVQGVVIEGDKRGRTMGFPTANIVVEREFLIPKKGVYVVEMKIDDKWYPGMCNIGYVPTFHEEHMQLSIEVHLLNFSEMIYGKHVHLRFVKRIRDEQKFSSVDAIISQLEKDKQFAQTFFEKK